MLKIPMIWGTKSYSPPNIDISQLDVEADCARDVWAVQGVGLTIEIFPIEIQRERLKW